MNHSSNILQSFRSILKESCHGASFEPDNWSNLTWRASSFHLAGTMVIQINIQLSLLFYFIPYTVYLGRLLRTTVHLVYKSPKSWLLPQHVAGITHSHVQSCIPTGVESAIFDPSHIDWAECFHKLACQHSSSGPSQLMTSECLTKNTIHNPGLRGFHCWGVETKYCQVTVSYASHHPTSITTSYPTTVVDGCGWIY